MNSLQSAFRRTSKSQLSKVIQPEGRDPINRQAALAIRPAKWYEKPLPPETDKSKNVNKLMEEINILKGKCYDANQEKEHAYRILRIAKSELSELRQSLETHQRENTALRNQLFELTNKILNRQL